MNEPRDVQAFLTSLPTPEEVRQRIAQNLRERQLLRHVLKLAIERQQTRQVQGGVR